MDALVKTNNIRFLRKKYVDPTTGKEEWKPIQFGQNKTPQAMGFFGQPLAAANGAGIGPSGGNTGTTTGIGGTSSTTGSGPTSSADSGAGTTGQSGSAGTDANGNPTSGTGTTSGTSGSAFGSSNNPTGSGQTFGGGSIIGFSPQSPKQSLMVYKKKNHYNEWEFLYSPQMDQQQISGGGPSPSPTPNGPNPNPQPQPQPQPPPQQ